MKNVGLEEKMVLLVKRKVLSWKCVGLRLTHHTHKYVVAKGNHSGGSQIVHYCLV